MKDTIKRYVDALAAAMNQEPPQISGTRAEFAVDDIPYVFTADADGPSIFVYAVIGALPQDDSAKGRVFAGLLHAQFCFSESCGFSFGVDAENSYVLLQALVDTGCFDENAFVALMDKFVKSANVWSKRLQKAEFGADAGGGPGAGGEAPAFPMGLRV